MYGYIYRVVNRLDGKCYIGQTVVGIEERIKQHLRNVDQGNESKFYKSIRHFGEENFDVYIIATIDLNSSQDIKKTLDMLESYFIKEFNSFENGYNSNLGNLPSKTLSSYRAKMRDKNSNNVKLNNKIDNKKSKYSNCKKVRQYGENGEFIKEYDSIGQASRDTGANRGAIYNCCVKRGNCVIAGGYRWSF